MVSRRMSRIVKMGVCCALKCMQDTSVLMPDGIIAGTGLGCLEDTEKFLSSIYTNAEKLLNPTPFIQSTHNTIAGAIALAIKCNNYNATYTQRGFSFENAVYDAWLQLEEHPDKVFLTGGFDELTEGSYTITRRLGLWKNHSVNTDQLTQYQTRGTLPGEGVAFFMLSGRKGPDDLAELKSMKTCYKPANMETIERNVRLFLEESQLTADQIDMVILGLNGDQVTDRIYDHLMNTVLGKASCGYFKHLCGEYDTASSFALWLASVMIKNQHVPDSIRFGNKEPGKLKNVLIYNHLRGMNHAMYLLQSC
jgi:3-oxoacyl-[acyl-carrier-protein] synthase II